MIIGLDLDEVAAKYVKGIRQFMVEKNNIPEAEILKHYPDPDTYAFDNWGEDFVTNFKQYHGEAVEAGLYQHLEVYENASERLWQLNDAGYHIRVISARFTRKHQHTQILRTTGEFLDAHNIPFRDIAITSLKTDIFADVYLDDSPKNIQAFQDKGANYIIFDRSYNQGLPGDRVFNWDECYNLILEKYPV